MTLNITHEITNKKAKFIPNRNNSKKIMVFISFFIQFLVDADHYYSLLDQLRFLESKIQKVIRDSQKEELVKPAPTEYKELYGDTVSIFYIQLKLKTKSRSNFQLRSAFSKQRMGIRPKNISKYASPNGMYQPTRNLKKAPPKENSFQMTDIPKRELPDRLKRELIVSF